MNIQIVARTKSGGVSKEIGSGDVCRICNPGHLETPNHVHVLNSSTVGEEPNEVVGGRPKSRITHAVCIGIVHTLNGGRDRKWGQGTENGQVQLLLFWPTGASQCRFQSQFLCRLFYPLLTSVGSSANATAPKAFQLVNNWTCPDRSGSGAKLVISFFFSDKIRFKR